MNLESVLRSSRQNKAKHVMSIKVTLCPNGINVIQIYSFIRRGLKPQLNVIFSQSKWFEISYSNVFFDCHVFVCRKSDEKV